MHDIMLIFASSLTLKDIFLISLYATFYDKIFNDIWMNLKNVYGDSKNLSLHVLYSS